jgi:hypothetical protein
MTDAVWNIEWLNQNSQRSYPLYDEATKEDSTGSITLPNSFIVGMYIPVHAGLDVDPEKFFLRQLQIDNVGFGIGIAYDDGTSDFPIVASVNISKAPHTENRTYALPGAGAFDQSIGRIAIGPLNEIEMRPNGLYLFDPINGRLDTDVIRPMIEGVTSITVVNGGERSPKLVGDIEFI